MTDEPSDELLDRLARGEIAAAADLYAAYTPYLRAVVRRQLSERFRAEFDSIDVVQSVWVHVVRRLGESGLLATDIDHLKAILATIARRRVIDRVRRHSRNTESERPSVEALAELPQTAENRPSEAVQADDVWLRLLKNCPPEHHEILRLRREGLPLAEVAARTGLHEGSVRRILRQLSREIAIEPVRSS